MTTHDVRNAAYHRQKIDNDDDTYHVEWYQQSEIQIDKNSGIVNGDTSGGNANSSYMEVALSVLNMLPEAKALRFKLVPAKLSECHFWSAVFYLLENCTPDDIGATSTVPGAKKKSTTITHIQTETTATAVSKNEERLETLLKQKDDELASLRLQLTQANKEIASLRKSNSSSAPAAAAAAAAGPHHNHRGKWVLSKEAIEFLSLDEELKEKLREGKRKRLQEVSEQMRFILDSDDVKDSIGKWDCCGEEVYESSCPP